MATFIRNFVDGCAICQQNKINHHLTSPPLQPIKPEHPRPFSLITMDFIMDLPVSDGFNSILVMVNHGSMKGVILSPCHKTIDSSGTATILLDSLYKHYGLPDKTISDRGPQFASHVFRELSVTIHFPKSLFPLSYLIPFPSHLVSSSDASMHPSSFPPHVSHMPYTCFPMHSSHHHILTPCFIHAPFISFTISHVHFIHISSYLYYLHAVLTYNILIIS